MRNQSSGSGGGVGVVVLRVAYTALEWKPNSCISYSSSLRFSKSVDAMSLCSRKYTLRVYVIIFTSTCYPSWLFFLSSEQPPDLSTRTPWRPLTNEDGVLSACVQKRPLFLVVRRRIRFHPTPVVGFRTATRWRPIVSEQKQPMERVDIRNNVR